MAAIARSAHADGRGGQKIKSAGGQADVMVASATVRPWMRPLWPLVETLTSSPSTIGGSCAATATVETWPLRPRTMAYVARLGFPVPTVYQARGADLVMERLDGPWPRQ